jgi:hypothetical protein
MDEVVETSEESDGYLSVPPGMIFTTDTYIPLDVW